MQNHQLANTLHADSGCLILHQMDSSIDDWCAADNELSTGMLIAMVEPDKSSTLIRKPVEIRSLVEPRFVGKHFFGSVIIRHNEDKIRCYSHCVGSEFGSP